MRTKPAPLLLVPVFLACAAVAQAPRPALTPVPSGKLPNSMRLDPSFLASLPPVLPASLFEHVDKALALAKVTLGNLTNVRENTLQAAAGCKSANFTQQDMTNAGCLDSETVAACSKKLYNHCTSTARLLYSSARSDFEKASKTFADAAAKVVLVPDPAELK